MSNTTDTYVVKSKSHPQDFAEWNPNPIIEINLQGEIIYLNLVARAQFPNLTNVGMKHPILSGLLDQIDSLVKVQGEFVVFFREVQYLTSVYEQKIFSVAQKTSIFIYIEDITSRKYAEKQLNKKNIELTETTSFLNNILESSIEHSIIATDLNGVILTWNAGAKHNYGFDKNEMAQKNIRMLFQPEEVQSGSVQTFMDRALQQGKTGKDFEQIRKTGDAFTAFIVMSVREDIAGDPIGYLLISKDVTEQKRTEEEVRVLLEEQNKLVRDRSHSKGTSELNVPLEAIINSVVSIYAGNLGPLTESQQNTLTNVLANAKKILRMINS